MQKQYSPSGAGFPNNGSTNCLLKVGAPNGVGYIRDADSANVNDPRDVSAQYRRD